MQVDLLFRSACIAFNLLCLIEIRLHLGNAQIYLAFLSICTNFARYLVWNVKTTKHNTMNISYNWLKEYVDFTLTPDEVAAALTSIGLETGSVEEVQTIKGGLEGIVIGEVLTCEPHHNSDHMHVTTVNLGEGDPVQIVCGAANVAAGQKVVVATLGTKLYDGDECFTIKKSKLRGVESNGMICAEDEIGLGTSHEGIIVLPADAVSGTLAKDY